MGFSPWHILIIVLVALLLFGPNKLPELGRSFGKMFREFKNATNGLASDDKPAQSDTAQIETAQQNSATQSKQ